jgi:glutamate-1-semialdehyde 2,1-aminomutase
MNETSSHALYQRALRVSPGGVHGAGRFYRPEPLFFQKMEGEHVWDVDGRQYIDLHASYGPAVLGHNDPEVRAAVKQVLQDEGVLFGTPHRREVELSETLVDLIPCAEMVALFGSGGSDPLYVGVRLARHVTGRRKVLKFEGEYHGWHDSLGASVRPPLLAAGPASAPVAVPVSSGHDASFDEIIVGSLNDIPLLERVFEEHGPEIACAVIEPVCHSAGVIPLETAFLARLRELCTSSGALLFFDEILTGFRHSVHGTQALVEVTPDLAAFGKAMGNGFAIAALVGRREIMTELSPSGPAFYSGTFNGHLISVAAAQATIRALIERRTSEAAAAHAMRVATEFNRAAVASNVVAVCQQYGSIMAFYFGVTEVRGYRDIIATAADKEFFLNRLFQAWLADGGVYMQPYFTNRCFISGAHTTASIDRVIELVIEFLARHGEEINAWSANQVAAS